MALTLSWYFFQPPIYTMFQCKNSTPNSQSPPSIFFFPVTTRKISFPLPSAELAPFPEIGSEKLLSTKQITEVYIKTKSNIKVLYLEI